MEGLFYKHFAPPGADDGNSSNQKTSNKALPFLENNLRDPNLLINLFIRKEVSRYFLILRQRCLIFRATPRTSNPKLRRAE